MRERLDELIKLAAEESAAAETVVQLIQVQARFLGKKGELTGQLKQLGSLPPEERPAAGELTNRAKDRIEELLAQRRLALEQAALDEKLTSEHIDVTLPGRGQQGGGL